MNVNCSASSALGLIALITLGTWLASWHWPIESAQTRLCSKNCRSTPKWFELRSGRRNLKLSGRQKNLWLKMEESNWLKQKLTRKFGNSSTRSKKKDRQKWRKRGANGLGEERPLSSKSKNSFLGRETRRDEKLCAFQLVAIR